MLMQLWRGKYSFELIKLLAETLSLGIIIVNIVAPLVIVYLLYDFVEYSILIIWVSVHISSFVVRMLINRQLIKHIKNKSKKVYACLKRMYLVIFISTLLYGYIIWVSILYNVPDTHIFLIATIISGLAAGSLYTLGAVFIAYLIYMVPNFLFLISAMTYHGGDIFELYALTMFTMMGVFLIAGYKHYRAIRNTTSLNSNFKTLYENSTDGIVIFQENKFVSLNKAMYKLFKYESEEALLSISLRKISPLYQPDGQSSVKKMVKMVQYTFKEGYVTFEWLHKDKNAKEFWCEIVLTKICIDGTDLIYGAWRDISDRKKLEFMTLSLNLTLEQRVKEEVELNRKKDEQMLHQSRLAQMGEMISMIAHQWRQPLSAISSAAALINLKAQLGKLDKETAIEISQNIANYTQHLSATIDDFRNFFKQDKHKEATSYTYLVNSVLNIIRISLENKNIKIKEELECKDSFMTYSNELKQVIINLVKNAQDVLVDHKITNPYIKLKSYTSDGKYILEITDNGGGISPNVIDKIFDPHFSTKLNKDGTGLGLYMSRTIVEEHCGGKLSCYNTQEGACFKLELPSA